MSIVFSFLFEKNKNYFFDKQRELFTRTMESETQMNYIHWLYLTNNYKKKKEKIIIYRILK